MSSRDSRGDAAHVRFPPPLVPLLALGIAALLQRTRWPLELPGSPLARGLCAAAALATGLALIGAALGLFRQTGQQPEPWKPSPELIARGVYRFTRNPMYLGLCLIQLGLGCALGSGWALALLPVTGLALFFLAIRPEEAYLAEKFGAAYAEYRRQVRRWI